MKRWMIFQKESDGVHYFYNGESLICIEPGKVAERISSTTLDAKDVWVLDTVLQAPRTRVITLKEWGRFKIVARGQFSKDYSNSQEQAG